MAEEFLKNFHNVNYYLSDPPTVHLNAKVVKVPKGDSVRLNCSVIGSPTPTVFWKRADKTIEYSKFNFIIENSVKIQTFSQVLREMI